MEVFGGKNSREKYVEFGGRAETFSVIFSMMDGCSQSVSAAVIGMGKPVDRVVC
jgi:hypothetical protein